MPAGKYNPQAPICIGASHELLRHTCIIGQLERPVMNRIFACGMAESRWKFFNFASNLIT